MLKPSVVFCIETRHLALQIQWLAFIWSATLNRSFKRQPHKMVKHTQTIRRGKLTNCLSEFDQFLRLALKGLLGICLLGIRNSLLLELKLNIFKREIHCLESKHKHFETLSIKAPFENLMLVQTWIRLIRKQPLEVFCRKIDVLRNFLKFTGKHLCWSLFFNKVAGLWPEFGITYSESTKKTICESYWLSAIFACNIKGV